MTRILIVIAVIITVGVLLYFFFPWGVIDYFSDAISPTPQPALPSQVTTQPPATNPVPQQPAPAAPPVNLGKPISEYLKIRHMAEENQVRIMQFDEPVIGTVTMQLRASDKNNIFDFMDAIERGISLRDIENKGYKKFYDNEGRQMVEAVIWIKYIPRYQ